MYEGCPNCEGHGCWLCGGTMMRRFDQMRVEADEEDFYAFCKSKGWPVSEIKQQDRVLFMEAIRWGREQALAARLVSGDDPEERLLKRFEALEVEA